MEEEHNSQEGLINQCSKTHLVSFPEFKESYDTEYSNYVLDDSLIQALQLPLSTKTITTVLGTWCGDSKLYVPHFLKVLDAAGFKEENLRLIGVNQSKKAAQGLIDHLNIDRVPTFIIFQDGKEIGRIVEQPNETFEKDILNILTK
ncbi:thioredoxin [Pedobacter sp. HMWF019]|uniref:thioredoxin family protein n=1 Tax=Pedobacter sp. HMWF019 TaxID=2056856 RepID=UPI000D361892|nr:thioredoxin family protein [Pedobacter sp. HMWF019]PTS91815.1 thioredoxin [Pedobacter sp. HMWF019]